jgi:ribosomal protein S12 methylthiotransferase
MPEVDAILGISGWDRIADTLDSLLAGGGTGFTCFRPNDRFYTSQTRRILTTGGFSDYLKIAEGCSKRCAYCVIPTVRGPYRSVPMEQLEEEARGLAAQGVRELILVAQETTLYGTDLYGKKMLPELLRRLCRIPGIAWIRILYCYPEEITDEMIDVIRTEPKICHYLDVPIQHASDRILRRMGRRTDQASIRRIIGKLREQIPDIVIRTTLMTGFPGETEEDFEELFRFVDEMEFERLGVFAYSREEGTRAAEMEDQVPRETAAARRDRLMELQQEISGSVEKACVGNLFTTLVEGKLPDEDVYVGRTYMDAPDVDGMMFIRTGRELMSGTFVKVLATESGQYDLTGEIYDEESESAE